MQDEYLFAISYFFFYDIIVHYVRYHTGSAEPDPHPNRPMQSCSHRNRKLFDEIVYIQCFINPFLPPSMQIAV